MRTTEIFVEQLLIGFMVLLIAGLPFIGLDQIGELLQAKETNSIAKSIVVGTAVLGAAYLLGVVFNRYADTRTEGFERHIRARLAVEYRDKPDEAVEDDSKDPFPEDRYRIYFLSSTEMGADWFSYLRSTIRLSRALVVFIPGLTLAGVLADDHKQGCSTFSSDQLCANLWGLAIIAASYFLIPILGFYLVRTDFVPDFIAKFKTPNHIILQKIETFFRNIKKYKAPRTDDKPKLDDYSKLRRTKNKCWKFEFLLRDILYTSLTWTSIALILAALVYALRREGNLAEWFTVLGVMLTGLASWSWWRITRTYMSYLRLFYKLKALSR